MNANDLRELSAEQLEAKLAELREERSKLTGSSWRAGERSDSHMAGIVAAPEEVAEALGIGAGQPVLRRSRT